MKNSFGAKGFPQNIAQASKSAGLQPVKVILSNDRIFTAQT